MRVITVDRDGKQIGDGEWVDIPKPEHFATDGFCQIGSYVSRLLAPTSGVASLIIGAFEYDCGLALHNRDGKPQISILIDWRRDLQIEQAIRETFERLGLAPENDYLAGNGGIKDATRVLGYHVANDCQFLTNLCADILERVYKVPRTSGLDFIFQTH
jgi:hypothetical protein